MNLESLRVLIRTKLEQGLLPYNSIPRVWGASGNGETCDGCDLMISPRELVIEGISVTGDISEASKMLRMVDRRRPLQLHVTCFYLWDSERRN